MGAIGGMLGLSGGASGSGFAAPERAKDQTGMMNLQNTYQQLQQVANGQGPNPAMAQYNQNIQNLAGQQAGAISSIQGISPALAARMISQQGSAAMQNAAAGGAKTMAEQQLGALGQQGQVAGAQAGNATAMQSNINQGNAGLAGQQMQNQGNMLGGLMQGAGMAMMAAGGGEVPAMAPPGPQSQFAQFLQSGNSAVPQPQAAVSGGMPSNENALSKGSSKFAQGIGSMLGGKSPAAGSMGSSVGGGYGATAGAMMARGGNVGAKLKAGGGVPGKPKFPGNNYANDTVKAKLSPGEVVIPNSIMQSADPIKASADFIANIIAKRRGRA